MFSLDIPFIEPPAQTNTYDVSNSVNASNPSQALLGKHQSTLDMQEGQQPFATFSKSSSGNSDPWVPHTFAQFANVWEA